MINIIKTIFAVIGLVCTAGSVTVALRCMWEGWKERRQEKKHEHHQNRNHDDSEHA